MDSAMDGRVVPEGAAVTDTDSVASPLRVDVAVSVRVPVLAADRVVEGVTVRVPVDQPEDVAVGVSVRVPVARPEAVTDAREEADAAVLRDGRVLPEDVGVALRGADAEAVGRVDTDAVAVQELTAMHTPDVTLHVWQGKLQAQGRQGVAPVPAARTRCR